MIVHGEANLRVAEHHTRIWFEQTDSAAASLRILVVGGGATLKKRVELETDRWFDENAWDGSDREVIDVDADDEAIRAVVETLDRPTLLILADEAHPALHAELFSQSTVATAWVRAPFGIETLPERLRLVVAEGDPFKTDVLNALWGEPTIRRTAQYDDVREKTEPDVTPGEMLVFGFRDPDESDADYRMAVERIKGESKYGVALVRDGPGSVESAAAWLERLTTVMAPTMERDERAELAKELTDGTAFSLEFLLMMSASAILAAFGLIQDSAAVIIGAMLIAPLMTPIMGAGLAIAQSNRPLFRRSLLTIGAGFSGAFFASFMFGLIYRILTPDAFEPTGEMLARCRPTTIDFGVGLVGGLAASYARTRKHLSAALAGSAIAAALVPPIATAGLHLAFQPIAAIEQAADPDSTPPVPPVVAPIILVGVNVLMIMVGSSLTLWSRGMRSDRSLSLRDRWSVRMLLLLIVLGWSIWVWNWRRNNPESFRRIITVPVPHVMPN